MTDVLDKIFEPVRDLKAARFRELLDEAGYVVVPKEPTEAMLKAGDESDYPSGEGIELGRLIGLDGLAIVYRAMIALNG